MLSFSFAGRGASKQAFPRRAWEREITMVLVPTLRVGMPALDAERPTSWERENFRIFAGRGLVKFPTGGNPRSEIRPVGNLTLQWHWI
jgi:hypothetical protein